MTEKPLFHSKLDEPFPIWLILFIPVYSVLIFSLLVLWPAGNLQWLEGWIFVGTVALNFTVSTIIINQKNPRVLRNRSKFRKEGITAETRRAASSDWFVTPVLGVGFLGAMVVPALGHRWGWDALPFAVALAGVIVVNIGFALMNVATLQNAFASKLLDINKDQVLVDTGLYASVRHPLYSGVIVAVLFMPIALGSLWGLLPALVGAFVIVLRIRFEEEMLVGGMDGYVEYQSRVKYKLIPGVY